MAEDKPTEVKESHKEETHKEETTTTGAVTETAKGGNSAIKIIVIVVVVLLVCCVCSVVAYFAATSFIVNNTNSFSTEFSKAINDAAKNTIQNSISGNDSTSTGNDSSLNGFSGTSDDGSFSFGGSLPSGFPSDVPVYSNSEVGFTSTSKNSDNGKDEYTATFTSSAKVADIIGFYKSKLPSNGWDITGEQNFFGSSITAEKGDREVTVVVLGDDSSGTDLTFTIAVTYK